MIQRTYFCIVFLMLCFTLPIHAQKYYAGVVGGVRTESNDEIRSRDFQIMLGYTLPFGGNL